MPHIQKPMTNDVNSGSGPLPNPTHRSLQTQMKKQDAAAAINRQSGPF